MIGLLLYKTGIRANSQEAFSTYVNVVCIIGLLLHKTGISANSQEALSKAQGAKSSVLCCVIDPKPQVRYTCNWGYLPFLGS